MRTWTLLQSRSGVRSKCIPSDLEPLLFRNHIPILTRKFSTHSFSTPHKAMKMSPSNVDRLQKRPRWASYSATILYVEPNGCIHSCLPFFVDSFGSCHSSLDDTQTCGVQETPSASERSPRQSSPTEPSDVDLYIDSQLTEIRESEGRRTTMACIFEEIIIRSKESSFLHSRVQEEDEHRRMMQLVFKELMFAVSERERRMGKKRVLTEIMEEPVLRDVEKRVEEPKMPKRKGKATVGTKTISPVAERENLMRELFGDSQEALSTRTSQVHGKGKGAPVSAPCALSPREPGRRPKMHHFQLQQPKVVY